MDRVISFDFDGVIHSYISGWRGVDVILDRPVPGIREAIAGIRAAGYQVVVHSYRNGTEAGRVAIEAWLAVNGIIVDGIVSEKPLAVVHIDDRCICFDGNAGDLLRKIESFTPWYPQEYLPWNDEGEADNGA